MKNKPGRIMKILQFAYNEIANYCDISIYHKLVAQMSIYEACFGEF